MCSVVSVNGGAVCYLASRGLQPRLRHVYSEWWSDSPLIPPNRLSKFVLKLKQGLLQYFLVDFTVRSSLCCSVSTDERAVRYSSRVMCLQEVTIMNLSAMTSK